MQTGNNAAVHILRSARDNQKVEVFIEPHEGEERVAIRYSTWVEDLGWCCQKTIRLDADQLDDLQRAVTVARHRLNRQRADAGQTQQTAQVIKLPNIA